jgi:hypothetical protein
MMSGRVLLNWVLVASALWSTSASAKVEIVTSREYSGIFRTIKELGEVQPTNSILLVFDIDQTLLNTENCIPGSQIRGLRDWERMIAQCPSKLTEEIVNDELHLLQSSGYAKIALTARSPSLIAATERELARNDISFLGHPFAEDGVEETWKDSIRVTFKEGVVYASGGDKGVIMREFLARKSPNRHTVVFVDDDERNIRAMTRAFENDEQNDVRIFHYNRYSE